MLARRIGPFPVFIWLILIVALTVGFIWWRRRKAGDSSGDANTVLPAGYTGGIIGQPTMYTYPTGGQYTVQQPSQPQTPTPVDPDTTLPYPLPGTQPDPVPAFQPDTPPARTSVTYVVKAGDTLSGIGNRYGLPWQNVYALNSGVIESTARAHGMSSSGNGHWIYPGTALVIPA